MTISFQQAVSVIKNIIVDGGISTEMIVSINVYTITLKSFVQFHNAQNVHIIIIHQGI